MQNRWHNISKYRKGGMGWRMTVYYWLYFKYFKERIYNTKNTSMWLAFLHSCFHITSSCFVDCNWLQSRDCDVLQTKERVVTVCACVVLTFPHNFSNRIDFTMELGRKITRCPFKSSFFKLEVWIDQSHIIPAVSIPHSCGTILIPLGVTIFCTFPPHTMSLIHV